MEKLLPAKLASQLTDVVTVRVPKLESSGKQRVGRMPRIFTGARSIGEFKTYEQEFKV